MAYVTVRQYSDKVRRDINGEVGDNQLKVAKDAFKHNHHIAVADMVLGGSLDKLLEEAYALTNSVQTPWYKNDEIRVSEAAQNGCRSTSIGDVVQVAGETYFVASCGFVHIDDI